MVQCLENELLYTHLIWINEKFCGFGLKNAFYCRIFLDMVLSIYIRMDEPIAFTMKVIYFHLLLSQAEIVLG